MMGDRGSFVTEVIYCPECLGAIEKRISDFKDRNFKILANKGNIIMGRIKSYSSGGEIVNFMTEYLPEIEKVICCGVRIAVLAECGEEIFELSPIEVNDG